jgi:hypothetical protein
VRRVRLQYFLIAFALALACNAPIPAASPTVPAVATSLFASTQTVPAASPTPAVAATTTRVRAYFRVAMLVDTTSEPVTREQAQNLLNDANRIFVELSGFGYQMTDFAEDALGGPMNRIVDRYLQAHAASLPNGIVVFSFGDDGRARLYGGYSYWVPGPPGFRNEFVSPVAGAGQIYVAVIHFSHKYAACGYGGTDSIQSPVSVGGECRNQSGTACVQHNGYSMCANAVGNLYASTSTYFSASTIVHEFLHPFSDGGDQDHYATPECNARMGWPAGFFDFIESEYYNGMCPFVYDIFVKSYQP